MERRLQFDLPSIKRNFRVAARQRTSAEMRNCVSALVGCVNGLLGCTLRGEYESRRTNTRGKSNIVKMMQIHTAWDENQAATIAARG
jgi:hypothetical protein